MKTILVFVLCFYCLPTFSQTPSFYKEKYRPQFHFTPPIHWMNDPNGLVYSGGLYHLFYQFNPFGNKWGHMSWGHATSTDLVHWQHLPLAIPEEKDTMIFSGSCVVDKNNTSGFSLHTGQVPLVAVYTGHIEGRSQSQHLSYSLDDGQTWIKYKRNPVLDLGKKDFRDPSVLWYQPEQKWIMSVVLPIEKQVQFYSSKNLREWEWMSSFGPAGDTTGIWECPALFQVPVKGEKGKTKWVLMLSPAPYMQYFAGDFDGQVFKNENQADKIYRPDYGADYYAAIVFNNLPKGQQPVSIGWVNNWEYAVEIPTAPWKSAMSLPRKLSVKNIGGDWILLQEPVEQLKELRGKSSSWKNISVHKDVPLPLQSQSFEMEITMGAATGNISGIRIAKGASHYLEIGYDAQRKMVYIDRSKAGDTTFHPAFAKLSRYETAARTINGKISLHIFFDKSIVEIFINNGEAAITTQIFPDVKDNTIELFSNGKKALFEFINYWPIKSVW